MKKYKALIFVAFLLLGGMVATSFMMQIDEVDPASIKGLLWPRQKPLSAFELVDHNGQALTSSDLQEQWSFLFFGYISCPDVCPITLNILKEFEQALLQQYPEQAADTRFIFISVDSERDQLAGLKKFTQSFSPNFLGASGTQPQIDSLARQLGIFHQKALPQSGDENYLISHSGSVLLINHVVDLTAIFQAPYQVEAMLERYMQIRRVVSNL